MNHRKSSLATFLATSLGLAAFSFTAHAATDTWTGATSGTWDTATANWSNGGTNTYTDGDAVLFSDTTGSNTTISITSAVSPASLEFADGGSGTLAYIFNTSAINGSGSVTLDSGFGGSVRFNAANGYTGGTTVNGGSLILGGTTGSVGTGTLTLNGGNFIKAGSTNQALTTSNALNVTGTTVFSAQNSGNWTISGAVTGSGTVSFANGTVNGASPVNTSVLFTGSLSGFTGTFSQVSTSAVSNRIRLGATGAGVTIDLSGGKLALSGVTDAVATTSVVDMQDSASGTFKIGELSGTGGILRSGWTATATSSMQIGALGTNSIYAGTIADNNTSSRTNGITALEKVGTGVLVLSKANGNAQAATGTNQSTGFSGGVTVTAGALLVTNTSGSGTGGGAVTVGVNGTLGGSGIVAPNAGTAAGTLNTAAGVTVSGIISPGGSVSATTGGTFSKSIGTLTFSLGSTTGKLTLNSGASFSFDLGTGLTSDQVAITGGTANSVVFNSNLINLNDLSGGNLTAGTYTLFSANAVSDYSGITLDGNGNITAGLSIGTGIAGYTANLQESGNNIVLSLAAVPEPSTWAMVLGGLGVLGFRQRFRRLG
ncbi:MAG: PEP-CTERM sorting domain-containing protein [Chthoniobacteraceae bacterium]